MASESHENPLTNLPHSIARLMQSVSSNFFSRFSSNTNKASLSSSLSSSSSSSSLGVSVPLLFADAPVIPFPVPLSISHNQSSSSSSSSSSISAEAPRPAAAIKSMPSGVRIDGLNPSSKGGPAFVGQVYSMCDPSGTGLMAVSAHFEIPFLSKRTPEWIKKMLAKVTKNEKNGPVFRFFMDLSDAVAYVKRLNIPTGMVGACRLDVAYEHFKEKPHMFQFVPNEKQVKEANKLLKKISLNNRKRRVEGVPVFTAQNLNIAIATVDGIKCCTVVFLRQLLLLSRSCFLASFLSFDYKDIIFNKKEIKRAYCRAKEKEELMRADIKVLLTALLPPLVPCDFLFHHFPSCIKDAYLSLPIVLTVSIFLFF